MIHQNLEIEKTFQINSTQTKSDMIANEGSVEQWEGTKHREIWNRAPRNSEKKMKKLKIIWHEHSIWWWNLDDENCSTEIKDEGGLARHRLPRDHRHWNSTFYLGLPTPPGSPATANIKYTDASACRGPSSASCRPPRVWERRATNGYRCSIFSPQSVKKKLKNSPVVRDYL